MTSRKPLWAGSMAGALVLAVIASGCGGGSSKTAAGPTGQVSTTGVGNASPVSVFKATGGGSFCAQIAEGLNSSLSGAEGATDPATMRTTIEAARKKSADAISHAPGDIKPDLQVLQDASDKLYAALDLAGYDYSKLALGATAAMSTPEVRAASVHVISYVKDKCGIDVLHQSSSSIPNDPTATSDSSQAKSATADSGSGADASACQLLSAPQVTTAMKQPMAVSGGAGSAIRTYSATADPSVLFAVQTYASPSDTAAMTQIEPMGEHIDALGDDAFWNPTLDMVFVRKGGRAFALTSPSLANLSGDPQASKSAMVDLAKIVLGKL